MPTREHVLALLNEGEDYEGAARRLGIAPGLAYLIATGRPADGSTPPDADELRLHPALLASSQHLVNPAHRNPLVDEEVNAWVRERAARELSQP